MSELVHILVIWQAAKAGKLCVLLGVEMNGKKKKNLFQQNFAAEI